MAGRAGGWRDAARHLPAAAVLATIALAVGGAVASLAAAGLIGRLAGGAAPDGLTSGLMTGLMTDLRLAGRAAGFTLWQAGLSTVLSVVPAVALARALHRHRHFAGRTLLLRLFALPLALPALIAALGLLALLGRGGLAAPLFGWLTDGRWPGIYGLAGILIAHVFFNLPLAARFLLAALDAVPADQWRTARQLGLPPAALFRLVEWPAMRAALPGAALTVFLLCATSFTLVLILGGGPQATTIEVAVYQALRFDFDPGRAAVLALVQLALAAVLAGLVLAVAPAGGEPPAPQAHARGTGMPVGAGETLANGLVIALSAALVALPVMAILWRGATADLARLLAEPAVRAAAAASLAVAALSAALAVAAAVILLSSRLPLVASRLPAVSALMLSVSPVVLGAGWFLALRPFADPFAAAPFAVVAANTLMALPFVLRALAPAFAASRARHDRLAAGLGLSGLTRFRIVEGRALRRPLGAAAALAALLSLGDLGVIALFGTDAVQTLPALLHARLGAYRTDDAAGIAALLCVGCLILMAVAERLSAAGDRENRS